MGIDFHGLQFLKYSAGQGAFGDTATIGRQKIHLGSERTRQILGLKPGALYGPYCEELLIDRMGASIVHSFDNSTYEGATVIHDFNNILSPERRYDTVVDFGSLEHVFNIAVALKNVSALCRQGGRILHALPANNFNGHGFWQFSPELFFTLYSEVNGYEKTEVFIANLDDERYWFRPCVPSAGARVEYTSRARSYVLVLTRKTVAATGATVQQSDYVHAWTTASPVPARAPASKVGNLLSGLGRLPVLWRLETLYSNARNSHRNAQLHRLGAGHKQFVQVRLDSF